MSKALNGAIVAVGIVGAAFVFAGSASAADVGVHVGGVGIGLNVGDVAYGYQDGYWDQGHQWHQWRNHRDMRDYRNARGNHYSDYKHDRDADQGWRR